MKVGIDIADISRFDKTENQRLISRILTEEEQVLYNSLCDKRKVSFLAGRWAVKEAIFKATQDKDYLKYSVLNDEKGAPFVVGHPEMSISISHEQGFAVAICIIV